MKIKFVISAKAMLSKNRLVTCCLRSLFLVMMIMMDKFPHIPMSMIRKRTEMIEWGSSNKTMVIHSLSLNHLPTVLTAISKGASCIQFTYSTSKLLCLLLHKTPFVNGSSFKELLSLGMYILYNTKCLLNSK